mmetsp:Transcript_596/g.1360  ORF Transcript_596/g.1360 Transcript_596/m.1360 type:complete len:453 (+) Transcript_596:1137-2495(+)
MVWPAFAPPSLSHQPFFPHPVWLLFPRNYTHARGARIRLSGARVGAETQVPDRPQQAKPEPERGSSSSADTGSRGSPLLPPATRSNGIQFAAAERKAPDLAPLPAAREPASGRPLLGLCRPPLPCAPCGFPRGGARLGAALLRPIGRIRGCADPRPLRRGLLRALLSLAVHQVARAGGFAALGAPAGLAPSPRPAVLLLPVRETLIALSRLRVRRGARAFPGPCVGVPGTGTAPAPPAAPPPSSLPVRVAARQGSRACSTAGFLPSAVGRPARRRKPEAQRSGFLATRACCAGGPFGGPWLQVPVRGRAVRPAVQLKPRGLPAPHWGEGHRRFRQLAVKVRNPKLSLQGALLCRELSIALLRCLTQRVLRKKQRRQVALVRVPHHRIRGLAKHSSGRCVLLYEPAQVVCSTADLGQPGEQPVKREALRLNHRRCFFTLHSNRLKTRLHFVVV